MADSGIVREYLCSFNAQSAFGVYWKLVASKDEGQPCTITGALLPGSVPVENKDVDLESTFQLLQLRCLTSANERLMLLAILVMTIATKESRRAVLAHVTAAPN